MIDYETNELPDALKSARYFQSFELNGCWHELGIVNSSTHLDGKFLQAVLADADPGVAVVAVSVEPQGPDADDGLAFSVWQHVARVGRASLDVWRQK